MLKKVLGIKPTKEQDGNGYIPSPIGLKFGVDKTTGYKPVDVGKNKYSGNKKVLVLCTEQRYFEMTNKVLFSTGNNVQETAVPLMHITNAGFDFDVITPTGSSAILEEWSSPTDDKAVMEFMNNNKSKFSRPLSLKDMFMKGGLDTKSPYVALFIPGGHGSMVGLPEDEIVGKLIRWIEKTDRFLVTVCHGPAALLATSVNNNSPHPYKDYSMAIFPDSADKISPYIGYLPGRLPWYQCEELAKQGLRFTNKKVEGAVHVDRKLLSGDSPKACDLLGRTVAKALLEEFNK